jgi:hypothetical protein
VADNNRRLDSETLKVVREAFLIIQDNTQALEKSNRLIEGLQKKMLLSKPTLPHCLKWWASSDYK